MYPFRRRAFAAALLSWIMLSGCTTIPAGSAPDPGDPWERVNRSVYRFNDGLDRAVAKPVAKAYRKVTPRPIRTGVSNFLDNITYPVTAVNAALQGKFRQAGRDTGRFLLNTVVGVGGILDPATDVGLRRNDEDFGQTLAVWGVPAGPYLMLPILGPSNVRDAPAKIVDKLMDPKNLVGTSDARVAANILSVIDTRAQLLVLEKPMENVFDRYAFLRNVWRQRRLSQIQDGQVIEEPPEDPSFDAPTDDTDTAPADAVPPAIPPPASGSTSG
ncbi:MAG: VacJ family lipoprotein [Steroidobacteraceae bacterium]|jgi:phospholipid-binding lipoprotein MlaA